MRQQMKRFGWGGPRAVRALVLGSSLGAMSACDGLLEADLPHVLTDAALESQASAETQVSSAIALFECGVSTFGWTALGHEGVFESIAGVAGTAHVYRTTPTTGDCDTTGSSQAWFDQIMGARALLSTDPNRLNPTGQGTARGVYDRMQDEWDLGIPGERLSAIAAIYMAASLDHFGEFTCEGALDESEMMTPTDFLDLAETWVDLAIGTHIPAAGGDFAMPNGIATSAVDMAVALRARIRWANGDLAGAAADAAAIPDDFTAWVTRESGETRRNKIHSAAGFSGMLGLNDWWLQSPRNPNPATSQQWADPIPFSGYLFLGIDATTGRALDANNVPIRWAEEFRALGDPPTPLGNGAVEDTRVPHEKQSIQGPSPREVPAKYSADDDDMPLVSWRELRLIRAEWENTTNNDQAAAIAHVNALRAAAGLPLIQGAYETDLLGDQDATRAMILEERKREFFAEGGRYWSTKIQNTDLLWFPRAQGSTPEAGYALLGGVRLQFPNDEYELNPNFEALGGLAARGTGCTSLPGAQAPII